MYPTHLVSDDNRLLPYIVGYLTPMLWMIKEVRSWRMGNSLSENSAGMGPDLDYEEQPGNEPILSGVDGGT